MEAARLRLVERLLDEGPYIKVSKEESACWGNVHAKLRMELMSLESIRAAIGTPSFRKAMTSHQCVDAQQKA